MTNDAKPAQGKSWRDVLPVHPAADLFPLMSPDELRELGEDIKKNGLRSRVVLWSPGDVGDESQPTYLLDGRNRLDAMELVGLPVIEQVGDKLCTFGPHYSGLSERIWEDLSDPYALVLSANIHRRHLTAEQKRELIVKVIKAQPEKSNRQIARQVKDDHKKVGRVRADLEARGALPHVEKTTDTKGRKQPARKKRRDVDDFLAEKREREAAREALANAAAIQQAAERHAAVCEKIAADVADDGGPGVAPPEEILSNLIETIERHEAVARAYKKVFKVSTLNQAQKDEGGAAISRLITTWQSVQRALSRQAPPAAPIQEAEPEITPAVTATAPPVEIPDLPEFLRRTA
jgi:hypothetical protein